MQQGPAGQGGRCTDTATKGRGAVVDIGFERHREYDSGLLNLIHFNAHGLGQGYLLVSVILHLCVRHSVHLAYLEEFTLVIAIVLVLHEIVHMSP